MKFTLLSDDEIWQVATLMMDTKMIAFFVITLR